MLGSAKLKLREYSSPGEYLQAHGVVIVGSHFPANVDEIVPAHFGGRYYPAKVRRICTREDFESQMQGLDGSCWEHFHEISIGREALCFRAAALSKNGGRFVMLEDPE